MKKRSKIGRLVKRGVVVLLESAFPKLFVSFTSEKYVSVTIGILFLSFFVWSIFTLAAISRSILSCCLLSSKKMLCYEVSWPLTLIVKYIFVKSLLLMMFIYIYISLKTSNILENKSQVFERSDFTIT